MGLQNRDLPMIGWPIFCSPYWEAQNSVYNAYWFSCCTDAFIHFEYRTNCCMEVNRHKRTHNTRTHRDRLFGSKRCSAVALCNIWSQRSLKICLEWGKNTDLLLGEVWGTGELFWKKKRKKKEEERDGLQARDWKFNRSQNAGVLLPCDCYSQNGAPK